MARLVGLDKLDNDSDDNSSDDDDDDNDNDDDEDKGSTEWFDKPYKNITLTQLQT